jgi:hypothetical protein
LPTSKRLFGTEQKFFAGDVQSFTVARTNWSRERGKAQLEPQGEARIATTIPIGMKIMKFCQVAVCLPT